MSGIKKTMKFAVTTMVIAGASILLQGCYPDDYLSRRDTVSLGAGDAIATNNATQVIDPWPAHAKDTDINIDGKRAQIAIDRYRQNKVIQPQGTETSTVAGGNGGGNGGGGAQVTN